MMFLYDIVWTAQFLFWHDRQIRAGKKFNIFRISNNIRQMYNIIQTEIYDDKIHKYLRKLGLYGNYTLISPRKQDNFLVKQNKIK